MKNEFKSMENYNIFKKIENENLNLAKSIIKRYRYNYDYQTKVNRYCEQLDVFLPFIYEKDKQKKYMLF